MLNLEDKEWIKFYLYYAQDYFKEIGHNRYKSLKESIALRKLLNLTRDCCKVDLTDKDFTRKIMLRFHEEGREMAVDELKGYFEVWNKAVEVGKM